MPTAKKRINIVVDDELYKALDKLAKKDKTSLSNTSLKLIEAAIELQEDLYFSRVADERLSKRQVRVSHKKAW